MVALSADDRMRVRARVLATALAELGRKDRASARSADSPGLRGAAGVCDTTDTYLYRITARGPERPTVGIVTGDIRRVVVADVWVNPENTHMQMARFEEHSVSAVIRFEGSRCDEFGFVTDDVVADELTAKVAGRTPVSPGTAVVTGSGELMRKNGVGHIVHVAAVQGEPGAGYRQVREIGRCVTHALRTVEDLARHEDRTSTVLLPILGVGTGGGELEGTVRALLGAAAAHFATEHGTHIVSLLMSAYTELERSVCLAVFDANSQLSRI